MGCSTQAVLIHSPDVLEISEFLQSLGEVKNIESKEIIDNLHTISFFYKNEERQLSVFVNEKCSSDYSLTGVKSATLISLGFWGHSVEIALKILDRFSGGWIDVNDSDDIDWVRHYDGRLLAHI